jgi:hypothetical protein
MVPNLLDRVVESEAELVAIAESVCVSTFVNMTLFDPL